MSKLDPSSAKLSASWSRLSLIEQMANIGSEVFRALKWRHKNNAYANLANDRALELFDLTKSKTIQFPALKELCRARELWLDYFVGDNQYRQTSKQWENYFMAFNYYARNKH